MLTFRGVRQVGKWLISSSHLDEGLFFLPGSSPKKKHVWAGELLVSGRVVWVSPLKLLGYHFLGGKDLLGLLSPMGSR